MHAPAASLPLDCASNLQYLFNSFRNGLNVLPLQGKSRCFADGAVSLTFADARFSPRRPSNYLLHDVQVLGIGDGFCHSDNNNELCGECFPSVDREFCGPRTVLAVRR